VDRHLGADRTALPSCRHGPGESAHAGARAGWDSVPRAPGRSLALARGDDVTLFHRGRFAPGLFGSRVEELRGDRAGDPGAPRNGTWDAAIDLAAISRRRWTRARGCSPLRRDGEPSPGERTSRVPRLDPAVEAEFIAGR
jgi:hypothetical protein